MPRKELLLCIPSPLALTASPRSSAIFCLPGAERLPPVAETLSAQLFMLSPPVPVKSWF